MAGDFSTNGARFDSPGQRLGFTAVFHQALKGRHNGCLAPSGLGSYLTIEPRALPWAIYFFSTSLASTPLLLDRRLDSQF